MAEIRLEGSNNKQQLQDWFDIKNSQSLLENLFGLLNVDLGGAQTTIPAPVILMNGSSKTGLSTIDIATNIIGRQTQAIEQQNYIFTAGGISEAMEIIRIDEIVKAIQTKMRVDIATYPTAAPVAGAAATVPLILGHAQAY